MGQKAEGENVSFHVEISAGIIIIVRVLANYIADNANHLGLMYVMLAGSCKVSSLRLSPIAKCIQIR